MHAQMEDVNTAAETLEAMARTLEQLVEKFQFADGPRAGTVPDAVNAVAPV